MEHITTKEGKIYSDLCERLPTISSRGNKHIYVIYVYDCNDILNIETNNRSDKDIIIDLKLLTEDLKSQGIHPGFYFMDNEASNALNLTMETMNIKCQLVPTINHRGNNAERAIKKFNNHFIAGLCSIDRYFHLQLWCIILQQSKISINLIRK